MANQYSQHFTLKDIFNNTALADKLPLINYKETELDNGKIQRRTNAKTINRQVFDISVAAARPFYSPLHASKHGDIITIEGKLVGEHNSAVETVYRSLLASRMMLIYTANNADMIRDALKESEKNKRKYGINSKLYLRVKSMQQIKAMNNKQIQALMNDIMQNIIYGDNFPQTQKKWREENIYLPSKGASGLEYATYEQQQLAWKRKVGDI